MTILYILLFLLILGIVVCFHEYGHYFFAKKAGIQINEFAFGMGPKLLSKKKGDTYWSLRAFPIGGFCAMSGEDATYTPVKINSEVKLVFDELNHVCKIILNVNDPRYSMLESIKVLKVDLYGKDKSDLYINDFVVNRDCLLVYSEKEEYKVAPEEKNFCSKTVWQRLKVCFGGPLNNLILGLFVFIILGMIVGVSSTKPIIGETSEGNNLYVGDEIETIDGKSISSWEEIGDAIYESKNRSLSFKLKGNEEIVTVNANYYFNNIGIASSSNLTGMYIIVETEAALAGNNRTKAYSEGGLRNNDMIVGLKYAKDGTNYSQRVSIASWDELLDYSLNNIDGGSIILIYIRDGVEFGSSPISVYSNELLSSQGYSKNSLKQVGISPKTEFNIWGGFINGFKYFINASLTIFSTLWLLITSSEVGLKDMGGFITILDQTAQYASSLTSLLYWIGLLSVNLGIVNLLPIPALDGGRILFLLVEGITGKKLKPKTENIIINIFFWLLMVLIIYILIQDVIRLEFKLNFILLKTFL